MWKFYKRKNFDLHSVLLQGGYIELQRQFRQTDFFESPEKLSFLLGDKLELLQQEEASARMDQRGPLWSKFKSEFVTYTKRNSVRKWCEVKLQQIYNICK